MQNRTVTDSNRVMKVKMSLIVSTYGRYDELELLLDSFTKQDANLNVFEVIIVDQNDTLNLEPLLLKYNKTLKINHYKASFKGLSKAKNKGIDLAKGEIMTFPDDDCTFYPDTISNAIDFLAENPNVDVVYGKVFDRVKNTNVMRNWSINQKKLNLFNFSLNYSAITCFTKLKLKFDEEFGVGSPIASGEELDYVIKSINQNKIIYYSPLVEVWHPELNVLSMNSQKVYNYAYGYGAIMRKNNNVKIFIIFLLSLNYQFFKLIINIFSKNSSKYYLACKGRIKGFLKI